MCDSTKLIAPLQAAMDKWALDNQCSCIDLESDSLFYRLWMFCVIVAITVCALVTVPVCWCTRPQTTPVAADLEATIQTKESQTQKPGERMDEENEEEDAPEPNKEKALEHFRRTSPTLNGQWRPIWGTRLDQMKEIGGIGTELYFTLLRNLGIVFTFMAAVTCVSVAFNVVSDFVPDNGQALARTTIGNIGATLRNEAIPPDQRYIILKSDEGCQGVPVTRVTQIVGWLDLASILMYTGALCLFRFVILPKIARESDEAMITPKDFAVEIDCLPREFIDMHVVPEDGEHQNQYEAELTKHLVDRLTAYREKERKNRDKERKGGADKSPEAGEPPRVEELVLVRDFDGHMSAVKRHATLQKDKAVAEYCKKEKQVKKLEKSIDKLGAKLEKRLKPRDELAVVRAYAILSTEQDVARLIQDYRFSEYTLLRLMQQCIGRCGCFERCCPMRQRFFRNRQIRIRQAPEPTDIIWENQDVPWVSRTIRMMVINIVFLTIVIISFLLIYAANFGAKTQMTSSNQYLGIPQCDPDANRLVTDAAKAYKCIISVASKWTLSYVETASKEEKACYCGVLGYSTIVKDRTLLTGVCKDWLISQASGVGLGALCTIIIVVINVLCKIVLLALAETEKPLSESALNSSKMVKIFALQTLNTGLVIFCVNFSPPKGLTWLNWVFRGEYQDSVRGWYAVVGATLLSNMLANAITPAATNVVTMVVNAISRWFFGRKVQHQHQLIVLYTNPPFDMAARFSQLLTTVYVTMVYSSGLPMLYLFAAGYMFFTYWADKIVLLWGSQRPPAYDTQIPKEATEIMLYAIPLHCIAAIWMLGQPCTYPSNPLGGRLAALSDQAVGSNAEAGSIAQAGGLKERLTKESTWMIFALLLFVLALYVLWIITFILGNTVGELGRCIIMCICPRRHRTHPVELAEQMTWRKVKDHIENTYPPASYRMELHPNFRSLRSNLNNTFLNSKSNFSATSNSLSPRSPRSKADDENRPTVVKADVFSPRIPVAKEVALNFIEALREEYVRKVDGAVGAYYEKDSIPEDVQEKLDPYETIVRNSSDDPDQAIVEIMEKWGLKSQTKPTARVVAQTRKSR